MLLINTLIELGQIREAEVINQELLKANPEDPQGSLSNGRILLAEGKNDQARTELEKGLKASPNPPRAITSSVLPKTRSVSRSQPSLLGRRR